MSFRVTQCPACESTFNINPRVLETAAGKVRCGACLTVFEAAENFRASEFDRESEAESVFVSSPAGEYFDPSRFLTRQSLREALAAQHDSEPESAPTDQPDSEPAAPPVPEPLLEPEDPNTPDYLALDSAELALDAEADIDLEDWVDPDEDEFLALVADAQQAPPDLRPAPPPAESLAARGYPALIEVVDALLAEDREAAVPKPVKRTSAEPPAAGGYPALEAVIDELLAAATEPAAEYKSVVPEDADQAAEPTLNQLESNATATTDQPGPDAPGSMPLSPEHEQEYEAEHEPEYEQNREGSSVEDQAQEAAAEPATPAPVSPPEAFQLHVQFSISSPAYGPLLRPITEPGPEHGADTKSGAGEQGHEPLVEPDQHEADFQQAVAGDMDSASSGTPDVELASDQEIPEPEPSSSPERETESPDHSIAAIRARALQSDLRDEEALEAIPRENLSSLGAFSTPVEILTGKQRRLGRQLAWASLALLAALLLTAQYLWQETARYAQQAAVRPLYEWACGMLQCELPVYNEIDAIQSSNLTVRSHPELDNALAVSVEFRNTADYAQRFPVMVLSFNSASNNVIALREFAAEEYLPPALRNRALLPPHTPVQVNLELIDPGDDAVNYTLAFRRP